MSQENVEIVRAWNDAYNRRDIDGLLAVERPGNRVQVDLRGSRDRRCLSRARRRLDYFKTLDDAYERFEVVPQDFIDAGASVLVISGAVWRGRESGAEGTTSIFVASHLKAGRMLRVETFTDRPQALEAVGLPE